MLAREFFVVYDQRNGGDTEQVEQVHSNGEAYKICYQDEPAVAMRRVGVVLPLEDEPEYYSCEE